MAELQDHAKRLQRFQQVLQEQARECERMRADKRARRREMHALIEQMAGIIREVRRKEGDILPLEVLLERKQPHPKVKVCFLNITKAAKELDDWYAVSVNPKMKGFKEAAADLETAIEKFDADHKKVDMAAVGARQAASWDAVGKGLQALKKEYKDHLRYVNAKTAKRGFDSKKAIRELKAAVDIKPYIIEQSIEDDEL